MTTLVFYYKGKVISEEDLDLLISSYEKRTKKISLNHGPYIRDVLINTGRSQFFVMGLRSYMSREGSKKILEP